MAFSRQLLNDNEEVVLDSNPHWLFMVGAGAMLVLGVVAFFAILEFVKVPYAGFGALLVLIFGVLGAVGRYLRWKTTEFVVTSDRVIFRQGIIGKSGIEIPLESVVNISFRQSFWQRLAGVGDLVMESPGDRGMEPFTFIADPSGVQNLIYRQIEVVRHRNSQRNAGGFGQASSPREVSIPEQIEKLAELNERGIISDEEFHQKKIDLLDRM